MELLLSSSQQIAPLLYSLPMVTVTRRRDRTQVTILTRKEVGLVLRFNIDLIQYKVEDSAPLTTVAHSPSRLKAPEEGLSPALAAAAIKAGDLSEQAKTKVNVCVRFFSRKSIESFQFENPEERHMVLYTKAHWSTSRDRLRNSRARLGFSAWRSRLVTPKIRQRAPN